MQPDRNFMYTCSLHMLKKKDVRALAYKLYNKHASHKDREALCKALLGPGDEDCHKYAKPGSESAAAGATSASSAAAGATSDKPGSAAAAGSTSDKPGSAAAAGATSDKPGSAAAAGATSDKTGSAAATGATSAKPAFF